MRSRNRRQASDVYKSRVQKKSHYAPHGSDYYRSSPREVLLVRERPGEGCRHLLTIDHLRVFLSLFPNWDEISAGLDRLGVPLEPFTDENPFLRHCRR
jgi:hypothetical protein